jgi:ornithine racemase
LAIQSLVHHERSSSVHGAHVHFTQGKKSLARLVVYKDKLTQNYLQISTRCNHAGLSLLPVLKEGVVRRELLNPFFEAGLTRLGLAHYPAFLNSIPDGIEQVLLYLTPWSDLDSVVRSYGISLQSDLQTLKRLAAAAAHLQKKHKVLLVAEVGDQREGIPLEEIQAVGKQIKERYASNLDLAGIAANFACLSDRLPGEKIFEELASCMRSMADCFSGDRPILSVGGSDVLEWVENGNVLPPQVTEIRCGTAVLLGTYPFHDIPVPGANTDAIILESDVLECRRKYGRLRAVVDFGTLDTSPADVKAPYAGMVFKGASSGYTVFDVTDCAEPLSTGRHISFLLNYRSLGRAFLSPRLSMKICN